MSSVPAEPRRPGANPAIVWPCRKRASSLPSRLVENLAKEMQTANIIPRWLVSQTSRVSRPAEPAAADRRMQAAFFPVEWARAERCFYQAKPSFDPVSADQGRPGPGSWLKGRWFLLESSLRRRVCVLHPCWLQIDSLQTRPGLQTQRGRWASSVKQANSHGCWLLTEERALFALLCHNDAASLIWSVRWDGAWLSSLWF